MPKVQKNELANVVSREVKEKIESLQKFDELNEIRDQVKKMFKVLVFFNLN